MNRSIEHSQVVTTSNYNTIADFHFTNHSTLICFHYSSLSVSWQRIYSTLTVNKSSNHTLSFHRLTSSSSSTTRTNYPWISPTDNWTEFLFPYSLIPSRDGPGIENTAPILLRGPDHVENTASSIAACWNVFTDPFLGNSSQYKV
jgi:hypothetical protein